MAEAYALSDNFEKSVEILREGLVALPEDVALCMDLADLLASAPYEGLRNADEAIRLAELAHKRSTIETPDLYDILGKAYAEKAFVEKTGDYSKAISLAIKAAQLAKREQGQPKLDAILARLRFYQSKKPYRIPKPRKLLYE